jgi:hypothetical protein
MKLKYVDIQAAQVILRMDATSLFPQDRMTIPIAVIHPS